MLRHLILILGTLSLTYTNFSSSSLLQSRILPCLDVLYLIYLTVTLALHIHHGGLLEDAYLLADEEQEGPATTDLLNPRDQARVRLKLPMLVDYVLMAIGFFQVAHLIMEAVTS